jgi:hypothetical protein
LSHQPFLLPITWLTVGLGFNKFKALASWQEAARKAFLARCDNAQSNPSMGLTGAYRRPLNQARARASQASSCPVRLCLKICPSSQDLPVFTRPARLHKTGWERHRLCRWPLRDRWPELEPHLAGDPVRCRNKPELTALGTWARLVYRPPALDVPLARAFFRWPLNGLPTAAHRRPGFSRATIPNAHAAPVRRACLR